MPTDACNKHIIIGEISQGTNELNYPTNQVNVAMLKIELYCLRCTASKMNHQTHRVSTFTSLRFGIILGFPRDAAS